MSVHDPGAGAGGGGDIPVLILINLAGNQSMAPCSEHEVLHVYDSAVCCCPYLLLPPILRLRAGAAFAVAAACVCVGSVES